MRFELVIRKVIKYKHMYLLFFVPFFLNYFLFCYLPMYGITLAFKNFQLSKGVLGSPWVGLENFISIFKLTDFWLAFKNTVIISFQRLVFEFPVPIILALLLNEVAKKKLKRFYQTVFTFPNFISWIVIAGVMFSLLADNGLVNQVLVSMGFDKQSVMVDSEAFRPLLYISSIWKSAGWASILYLASIAAINHELYESAYLDGANRFDRLIYITLPGLNRTIALMIVLSVGGLMNGSGSGGIMPSGFDQIFNLYNPAVYDKVDIIDTYVYRRMFVLGADYGATAAIGLFKSIINFAFLLGANFLTNKINRDEGVL